MRLSSAVAVVALVAILGLAHGENLKTRGCPSMDEINSKSPDEREKICTSKECNKSFCVNMQWNEEKQKYEQVQLEHAKPCVRSGSWSCERAFGVLLASEHSKDASKVIEEVNEAAENKPAEERLKVDVKQLVAARKSSCNGRSLGDIEKITHIAAKQAACLECDQVWCLEAVDSEDGWKQPETPGEVTDKQNVCVDSAKKCKVVYTDEPKKEAETYMEGASNLFSGWGNKMSKYWQDQPEHGISLGIRFNKASTDHAVAIIEQKLKQLTEAKKHHHEAKAKARSAKLAKNSGLKKEEIKCEHDSLDAVNAVEDLSQREVQCLGCDFAWCANIAFHDRRFFVVPVNEHSDHTMEQLKEHNTCVKHRQDCGKLDRLPLGIKYSTEDHEKYSIGELENYRIKKLQKTVPIPEEETTAEKEASAADAGSEATPVDVGSENAPADAGSEDTKKDAGSEDVPPAPPAVEKIEEQCHEHMPGIEDGTAKDQCDSYINNLRVFAGNERKVYIPVGEKCVEQMVSMDEESISANWVFVENSHCDGAAEHYPSCSNEESDAGEEEKAMCEHLKSEHGRQVFKVFSCEIKKGKTGQEIMDTCKKVANRHAASTSDDSGSVHDDKEDTKEW